MSMRFEQGQFADTLVLERMGLLEDVAMIFKNMGLEKFWLMKEQASQTLTCKFLASLKVSFYDEYDRRATPQTGFGEIEFTLDRNPYRMTFHELSEVFGFSEEGTVGGKHLHYPKKELQFLWETIASGHYKPGTSKNSWIRHPALRYVHKVLAHMFFAKVEFGTIAHDEMELLGLGLKPLLTSFHNGIEFKGIARNPGLTSILIRHLFFYKAWAWGTKGKRSALSIGWLITPILRAKGVKVSFDGEEWKLMDEAYLARTKFFKGKIGDKFVYNLKLGKGDPVQVLLPNPSLTNILDKSNIFFYPTKDTFYNPTMDPPIDMIRLKKKPAITNDDHDDFHRTEGTGTQQPSPIPTYGSERYSFDPYNGTMPDVASRHAHHQTRLLQRWCKWQDRTIKKLVKTVKNLKKKVKDLQGHGDSHGKGETTGFEIEDGSSTMDQHLGPYEGALVIHEGTSHSSHYTDKKAKRKAMRSPSPCSSNPSYSMGSSSPSQSS